MLCVDVGIDVGVVDVFVDVDVDVVDVFFVGAVVFFVVGVNC